MAGSAVEAALLDVDVPELDEDVAEPLVVDEPLDPVEPPVWDDPLLEEFDPLAAPPVAEELPADVPEPALVVLELRDCCCFS